MNRKELNIVVIVAVVAGLIGGAVSSTLFQVGLVTAQETKPKPNIIEAEGFRVVKDGKTRAELSVNGKSAGLTVYGKGDNFSAKLMGSEDSAALLLRHPETGLASLTAIETGLSLYFIVPGTGHMAKLLVTEGLSSFELSGPKSRSVSLHVGADGSSSVSLKEAMESRAILGNVSLEATKTGDLIQRPLSSLVLLNEKGNVVWKAP